jgi:hypothetical protein
MEKSAYHEGDLFSVPVENAESIVGLIVRVNKNKILAYFFRTATDASSTKGFEKDKVLLIKLCSTLGLDKHEWNIIGRLENWNIKDWPVPVFKRVDVISKECYQIYYNDALEETSMSKAFDCVSLGDYPEDGLAGYGFIEKRLARLLG